MKRNPWPHAIIAYFVVFISGIVTWVTFAMRHDDQLVRADYYEHEMTYQKQIDRLARAATLKEAVQMTYSSDRLTIALPPAHANAIGTIKFYRPSQARLDLEVPLKCDPQGRQTIPLDQLAAGVWKIQLSWSALGEEYYREERLLLSR